MDVTITKATDVITREITEHGIIHGMGDYKNRTVKIVVLESATKNVSEKPYSAKEVTSTEDIETFVDATVIIPPLRDDEGKETHINTLSLMRDYVSHSD